MGCPYFLDPNHYEIPQVNISEEDILTDDKIITVDEAYKNWIQKLEDEESTKVCIYYYKQKWFLQLKGEYKKAQILFIRSNYQHLFVNNVMGEVHSSHVIWEIAAGMITIGCTVDLYISYTDHQERKYKHREILVIR